MLNMLNTRESCNLIVHRDLKFANLFWTNSNLVFKILIGLLWKRTLHMRENDYAVLFCLILFNRKQFESIICTTAWLINLKSWKKKQRLIYLRRKYVLANKDKFSALIFTGNASTWPRISNVTTIKWVLAKGDTVLVFRCFVCVEYIHFNFKIITYMPRFDDFLNPEYLLILWYFALDVKYYVLTIRSSGMLW